MKEMKDLLIKKVEKSMEGKVKEMEKNVVEQVKGMMMEVLQRMETEVNEKIYHREHEKRNKKGESRARGNEKYDCRRIKGERRKN